MLTLSLTWLVTGSLLLSIISASPTRIEKRTNYLPFRPKSDHSKRALPPSNVGNIPEDFLPGCEEKYDPSYAIGPSRYPDGKGYALTSSCDNGKGGKNQCWTDTYVVEWEFETKGWAPTGQAIDCKTSSDCAQKTISLNQTCTKNKITKEGNTRSTFELKLPEWFEGFNPGFTFLESSVTENLATTEICTKTTSEGECNWDDSLCHGIWTAQRTRKIWGYQRRTCRTPRAGVNMPNTSPRFDGLYTVGMQDFTIEIPEATVLGCGAPCSAVVYPGDPPAEPQDVTEVLG